MENRIWFVLRATFVGLVAISAGIALLLMIRAVSDILWTEKAAGWAQALGGLASVGAAIFIASSQARSDRANRRRADFDSKLAAAHLLQSLVNVLGGDASDLLDAMQDADAETIGQAAAKFRGNLALLRGMFARPMAREVLDYVIRANEACSLVEMACPALNVVSGTTLAIGRNYIPIAIEDLTTLQADIAAWVERLTIEDADFS